MIDRNVIDFVKDIEKIANRDIDDLKEAWSNLAFKDMEKEEYIALGRIDGVRQVVNLMKTLIKREDDDFMEDEEEESK